MLEPLRIWIDFSLYVNHSLKQTEYRMSSPQCLLLVVDVMKSCSLSLQLIIENKTVIPTKYVWVCVLSRLLIIITPVITDSES